MLLPEPELKIGKSKKVPLAFLVETKDFLPWEISTMLNSILDFRMAIIVILFTIVNKKSQFPAEVPGLTKPKQMIRLLLFVLDAQVENKELF